MINKFALTQFNTRLYRTVVLSVLSALYFCSTGTACSADEYNVTSIPSTWPPWCALKNKYGSVLESRQYWQKRLNDSVKEQARLEKLTTKDARAKQISNLRLITTVCSLLNYNAQAEGAFKKLIALGWKGNYHPHVLSRDYKHYLDFLIERKKYTEAQKLALSAVKMYLQIESYNQAAFMIPLCYSLKRCLEHGAPQFAAEQMPIYRETLVDWTVRDGDRVNIMMSLVECYKLTKNDKEYARLNKIAMSRLTDKKSFVIADEEDGLFAQDRTVFANSPPEKLIPLLQKLLAFRQLHYGPNDYAVIATYIELGNQYAAQLDSDTARQYFTKALELVTNPEYKTDYWYVLLLKKLKDLPIHSKSMRENVYNLCIDQELI